jgi:hypothetical protein
MPSNECLMLSVMLCMRGKGNGVLTKQIFPLEVRSASVASELSTRMIEEMPLQMLGPGEAPSTSILVALESPLALYTSTELLAFSSSGYSRRGGHCCSSCHAQGEFGEDGGRN